MTRRRRTACLIENPKDLPRPFRSMPLPTEEVEPQPNPLELEFRRGREAGLAEAHDQSEAAFERQANGMREQIARTLERLGKFEETQRHDYQRQMIDLALLAASRITREKIDADDPIAARALAAALDALPTVDGISARVHPEDLATIRSGLSELIQRRGFELSADATVSRGGCIVESQAGTIDATLESAVGAVQSAAHGKIEGA